MNFSIVPLLFGNSITIPGLPENFSGALASKSTNVVRLTV
jgi:hypothetical protein